MDTEARTVAQALITGFIGGFAYSFEGGPSVCDPKELRSAFWQWAPSRIELEYAYVGELSAWLEQVMGELGVGSMGDPNLVE